MILFLYSLPEEYTLRPLVHPEVAETCMLQTIDDLGTDGTAFVLSH